MVCSERFEVRLTPDDRRRLRELAAATHRTEGDVLRVLVRSVPPERVGPGVPPPILPRAVAAIRDGHPPLDAA